ncbi:hypothetical protein OEZ86_002101 [Tetradesmus obliquus]|nr:hypothetical protein OEZ86_002101 [Tetradesmus obliquus]
MCKGTAAAASTNRSSSSSSSSSSGGEERKEGQAAGAKCSRSSPLLAQGGLSFKPLAGIWEAQEHIRAHGGVVTALTVQPSSLEAFLADPANKHKPYSCSATAAAAAAGAQPHAEGEGLQSSSIFVVGYDNEQNFWIAKAAQGRSFGTNGFLRIAYGECGIMDPSKTFGMQFKQPAAAAAARSAGSSGVVLLPTAAATPGLLYRKALQPAPPGKPANCRLYSAGSNGYVSRVARVLGVPVGALLADNADVIRDLGQPLIGKQLLVCVKRGGQQH